MAKRGAVTVPHVNPDPFAVSGAEGEQASVHASKQAPEWPQLPGGRRVSVSYYFAPTTADALDAAAGELAAQARKRGAGRISKSDLVELAVVWALEDLERNGEKSLLGSLVKG